ncbi:FecR domain-containing protein [Chitinophaga arvensicola]|uniref:Ferric-dicitrate binding protein FerR, regulates iron transport through sigma-19 n=1 Tax=Chitinophaga arvensicola TaxID=29529 RepID=A0A1I0RNC9_9BACT|nr:FecR domain-containing protein [Chitinophaga arvensicola]SEW42742.1 ferric-dicitrate binding protein FerR, regulates iron transport through sigma-19 [Chitinophaga arvensicola]
MQHHRFDELITAKLSGTLDHSGEQELAALLEQHPEWGAELSVLEQYWQQAPEVEEPSFAVFREMMDKAEATPAAIVKPMHWWKPAAAAVVAGLLCMAGFHLWKPRTQPDSNIQLVQTGKAERRQFVLSDGSKVHLNASSQLKCHLDPNSREIWLEGEAYFEVAKDVHRPFIVHAAALNIHALGTAFNVKAYPQDEQYETTLLEGAVEVYLNKKPEQKVRLRPYEKLLVGSHTALASPEEKLVIKPVLSKGALAKALALPVIDSTLRETAWISNRLQFDSLSFEQLARELERWYGVQIEFRNEGVKKYIFSGSFASETVIQALQALQLTEDFHYKYQGTQIIIY